MGLWTWLLIAGGVALAVWATLVATLFVLGRRQQARAIAGFVPDCAVLFRRLLADPRVPRARKLAVAALVGYLAFPFDLVPDFIPVVGVLDDALLVALVLRLVLRGAGAGLVAEHWPGPPASLGAIMRLAGASAAVDAPEGPLR